MSYAIKIVRYNYLVGPFDRQADAAEYRFRHCYKEDEVYPMYPPLTNWRERSSAALPDALAPSKFGRDVIVIGSIFMLVLIANMLLG